MIQADVGDHGQIGIDDIDGIQPPAEPDLQHYGIQPGTLEQPERRQRAHFEIGKGNLATSRFDHGKRFAKLCVARFTTTQQDTLVVAQQVGGAVAANFQPLSIQQRGDEGTGGALAVGASDRDHQRGRPCHGHPGRHRANPIEAHVDGGRVQLFQVGEPVGQAPAGHALAVT